MEFILEELNRVLDEGRSLLKKLEKQEKDLIEKESNLDKRSSELQAKESDFSVREANVSKIENVSALHTEAKANIDKANEMKNRLQIDRDNFENYKKSETNRINDLRKIHQREMDGVEQSKRNIKAEIDKGIAEFASKFKQVSK